MTGNLPDLTVKHRRIDTPKSTRWNLIPYIYEGGTKINTQRANYLDEVARLPLKSKPFISIVEKYKTHTEGLLDSGASVKDAINNITCLKAFVGYADTKQVQLDTVDNIRQMLFTYSEHQFTRVSLKQIAFQTAYYSVARCVGILNVTLEDLQFNIDQTRLKPKVKSRRALSRSAEKVKLSDASELANFCFKLTQNFKPSTLTLGTLPILVNIDDLQVNLTSAGGRKKQEATGKNFIQTQAYQAFNTRVSAETMIFLAMTIQNQAPTYLLKRSKFDYKPLDEKYEVREFKARRGGEVLFKIPKPYKPYFERYIYFLDEYAPDSEWLFPYLVKGKGFRKSTDDDTARFRRLCLRYQVPWVPPSSFRSIGENLLMRMASDEKTAADYAGHAVATFRQSYEFPSLQRAMIQIGQFWDENDPLTHGKPTVSLFNSPCNGVPTPIEDATNKLPKPDCINPTGCIGCVHFRDDDSLDYVWNLHSFRYLEIIASSSHRTKETKTSNIAIDWANLKINWFKTSKNVKRRGWVDEAQMRVEEGEYHPNWSRKIQKFEG
jgi:hypothetical protein